MDQATYNYTAKSSHTPTLEADIRGSTVSAVTAPMAMAPATPNHAATDQELVSLCAQHIVNRQAVLDCPLDPDDSPSWLPYAVTHDAISNARPKTLAGLIAKARAAKGEASIGTGNEDPLNGSALEWAWDIVNDLIRLDGETV